MAQELRRIGISETVAHTGEQIKISGWVRVRRDHGKVVFFDVCDASGEIQMVILPQHAEAHSLAESIRPEWVIEAVGKINPRPEKLVNAHQPNGAIELEVESLIILNEALTPPFDVRSEGIEIGEEHRLKYRYLDLRRSRMQKNLRMRHAVNQLIRNFLTSENFIEIETPLLTRSTPEGARDYLVPSRVEQGKFYALPQSPQQYKQLLMVGGVEKYFQIARCMRDEDTRGDRQPEFTQLDLEMSFVGREDVMKLTESLLIKVVQELYPTKKIQSLPFPRMSFSEAMEKYGTDRPDIRTDKNDPDLLAFCWVVDFPFFEKTDSGGWTFTHNPFSRPLPEHEAWLLEKKNIGEILTTQYDIVLNGLEVGGGSMRNHRAESLKRVFEIMGFSEERIQKNFGHMLEALSFGAPPHGGIAPGLDRLLMILQNEPNIREVIAFAKTGEGKDLMMQAPSEVSAEQLRELGIRLRTEEPSS